MSQNISRKLRNYKQHLRQRAGTEKSVFCVTYWLADLHIKVMHIIHVHPYICSWLILMVLRGLEGSFCRELNELSNFPPQKALELPKNKTLKSESAIVFIS